MREIKGYEAYYHFDEFERVVNTKTNKVKKVTLSNNKYLVVDMYKNGKRKTELLHRLVAETYLPNIDGKRCVNHKDGNKQNNKAHNLEWCSYSENIKHSYDHLNRKCKMNWKSGADNANAKAVIQLTINGDVFSKYGSIMDAERATGILNNSIVQCLKGKYKTAGGYKWQYAK